MIRIYTKFEQAQAWLQRFRTKAPLFACVLGFTETGLIPGISAAGATPSDRQYTALADAEFLIRGAQSHPKYALPPLQAGASPVLITRAVVTGQQIPVYLFNAGLSHPLSVPAIELGGRAAGCLSQAEALPLETVQHLFQQGLAWGKQLAAQVPQSYVILSECVVGGTTTALAILTGLGWNAVGLVNSSHPTCNHQQKWEVVQTGLEKLVQRQRPTRESGFNREMNGWDPFELVAAVGDPMQIVVAGMTIAASRTSGVLLAGGTQMLAVYALIEAIAQPGRWPQQLDWQPEHVVVGTTRWVAEDPTGDTVGLARLLDAPLLATQLSFAASRYASLRAYEQGYVKEGVGAGGSAIAATLYQSWDQSRLLEAIETLAQQL
ncbi:MAG: TIGR00303 family protein [Elainella sp. C42_A2020_010]|nr:TIGR00303 family protein [Elainella sp. C42_A2020_010]